MRVEPHIVGSYVHALKRGARGLPITKDLSDQWRFVRLLFYMNDEYSNENWERETETLGIFKRSDYWPQRKPLVKILAWVLMPNHFHLLLEEITENGISRFMHKLGNSMSTHANLKYEEKGSLFQGPYKARTVSSNEYLQYLAPYIMVKNVFELYPKGLEMAIREFDRAWQWALQEYPFSSLADYVTERVSPIINKDILGELFPNPQSFYKSAKDMTESYVVEASEELRSIVMDVKEP